MCVLLGVGYTEAKMGFLKWHTREPLHIFLNPLKIKDMKTKLKKIENSEIAARFMPKC